MILPTKHLSEQRSLLRVGAELLLLLRRSKTVSRLWADFRNYRREELQIELVTYDWFILALDLLFIMGAIIYEDDKIRRYNNDSQNL